MISSNTNDDNGNKNVKYSPITDRLSSSSSNEIGQWWAFVGIGLMNNLPYVLLLACAKNISEGGTALVFICSVVPGLVMKLSAPYWFPSCSYWSRIFVCSILMISSFALVTLSGKGVASLWIQLFGVALTSIQCSLGEATLLALAGKKSDANNITAFSTGTGWAGVVGFGIVIFVTQVLKLSILFLFFFMIVISISYFQIFVIYLSTNNIKENNEETECVNENSSNDSPDHENDNNIDFNFVESIQKQTKYHKNGEASYLCTKRNIPHLDPLNNSEGIESDSLKNLSSSNDVEHRQQRKLITEMGMKERFFLTLSFWPYAIPLALVYFAEYALQSGVWSAMAMSNTDLSDKASRKAFFTYANWAYQAGVCVSRSSTLCIPVLNKTWLWILPILQCVNLIIFCLIAASSPDTTSPYYNYWHSSYLLLPFCAYVGLLGGAVYVHGYSRIRQDMMPNKEMTEFALATVTVADGIGVSLADIIGLFLQSCLFSAHGLSSEAIVACPL